MIKWIEANVIPVLFCTITSMLAALAIMFNLWQGAQHEAQVYKDQVHSYEQIVAAQSRISQNETRVNRVTDHTVERIMESPNANTPVPNDLAIAWATGIDSVWDSGETTAHSANAVVSGPTSRTPRDGKSDYGSADGLLGGTRSSLPKVQ